MQIRKPEPTVTPEEIKKMRDEVNKIKIEQPVFDFSKKWDDIDQKTANAFGRKCEYITEMAIKAITIKHNLKYSEIVGEVFLDPEIEWNSSTEQVSDEDWIDATIQSFEDELREDEYI